MENIKKRNIVFAIGGLFLLILIISASYAYYHLWYNSSVISTTVGGGAGTMVQPYLVTNITDLNLNITKELMNNTNIGKKIYATESGTPVTEVTLGSGRYQYATASILGGNSANDCTYDFNLRLTSTKNASSIPGLKVAIIEEDGTRVEYSYDELSLFSGVAHQANFRGVLSNAEKSIYIEMFVENVNEDQSGLLDNELTLTISPGVFSCSSATSSSTFANELIESGILWQSGLEGDGYRYIGSGDYTSSDTPDNFICLGTTSSSECKANEFKYMYRIIGVFPDEQGKQHLKLMKLKRPGSFAWHTDSSVSVDWGNSSMFSYLNGSGLLTNSSYDYFQNQDWLVKIADWKWTAVNTLTNSNSGPNYAGMSPQDIYLHEMNRSSKTTTVGEWTYPTAKIGILYLSDYGLSIGEQGMYAPINNSMNLLRDSWLHHRNNDSNYNYHFVMARVGGGRIWDIIPDGSINNYPSSDNDGAIPTLYLKSNVVSSGGTGDYNDPYMIEL